MYAKEGRRTSYSQYEISIKSDATVAKSNLLPTKMKQIVKLLIYCEFRRDLNKFTKKINRFDTLQCEFDYF